MTTNAKLVDEKDLIKFAEENLADAPLVGLLQVGSSARGHALPGSDVDMMAFYKSGGTIKSHPNHTFLNGVPVTLEHHDVDAFIESTSDYRFNMASLRQLHKIRDAVVLKNTERFPALLDHAQRSHLDKTIPLSYLSQIAAQWPKLGSKDSKATLQTFALWVESLGTLSAVSTAGSAAYSKPKWLYRTLRGANHQDAIDLLNTLHAPSKERLEKAQEAFETLIETYDWEKADEFYKRLLKTAVNDSREMLKHTPEEAMPTLRFTAGQFYRAFIGGSPFDKLCSGEKVPEPFSTLLSIDETLNVDKMSGLVRDFSRQVFLNTRSTIESTMASEIGTNRFFTHMLDLYGLNEILPASTLSTKQGQIKKLNQFFEPDTATQPRIEVVGDVVGQNQEVSDGTPAPGKLIVLCGIDGSGKTTQERVVLETLDRHNISHYVTKQPTDWYRKNPIIREFLDTGKSACSTETIGLIAAADRMLHIETEIKPRTDSGIWVVSNRYVYSTYGYFLARGADMGFIEAINSKVPEPDYGIFLEMDPRESVRRIRQRDGDKLKFEERKADYLAEVQQEMLSRWPKHFLRLNATLPREQVTEQVVQYMEKAVREAASPKSVTHKTAHL